MAMNKQFKIRSFDDLIEFIENEEASPKEIEEIVRQTIGVIILFDDYYDKSYLINRLKDFWHKFKHSQERPIFLLQIED
jgi:hypothetical protein